MNFIWDIIRKMFATKIAYMLKEESIRSVDEYKKRCVDIKNECIMHEYPIGSKVISIPNEPSELIVGEVVGYDILHGQLQLNLRNVKTGEVYFMFDARPIHWTPELEYIFGQMDWVERWNVYTKGSSPFDDETRKYKEGYTPGFTPQKRLYNPQ